MVSYSDVSSNSEAEKVSVATDRDQINWLSWEDAMELYKAEPRKIMVNIYTDHCGWCSHMDRTTYKQSHLIDYINENFYAVKLNAEQRSPIQFKNKTYKYVKSGTQGYHEFAASITMGGLGTPAMVFIDSELEVIQPMLGYKDPDNFEMIITYFGEDQYLSTPWNIYQTNYIPMTKPELLSTETEKR